MNFTWFKSKTTVEKSQFRNTHAKSLKFVSGITGFYAIEFDELYLKEKSVGACIKQGQILRIMPVSEKNVILNFEPEFLIQDAI